MKYIYEPRGRAREYSPLAFNIYNGCDHDCKYCYIPAVSKGRAKTNLAMARDINLEKLLLEAQQANEQILLCFVGDPYCNKETELKLTRKILHVLLKAQAPVAILTKGGTRALRDLDLFTQFESIKVGTTLTFHNPHSLKEWEPNAAGWLDRKEMLEKCHDEGLRTFASIEPVISPRQTIDVMNWSLHCVDEYLVGKLNHDKERERTTNWNTFGIEAMMLLNKARKDYYIKKDLRDRMKMMVDPPHNDPTHLYIKRKEPEPVVEKKKTTPKTSPKAKNSVKASKKSTTGKQK